jgi:hypothetical protein
MVQGSFRENASADDGIKKTPREGDARRIV